MRRSKRPPEKRWVPFCHGIASGQRESADLRVVTCPCLSPWLFLQSLRSHRLSCQPIAQTPFSVSLGIGDVEPLAFAHFGPPWRVGGVGKDEQHDDEQQCDPATRPIIVAEMEEQPDDD